MILGDIGGGGKGEVKENGVSCGTRGVNEKCKPIINGEGGAEAVAFGTLHVSDFYTE